MFQPFDPLNAEEASANLSNFLSPIRRQATASPGGAVHYDTMSLEKMAKVHRTAAGTFVRLYPFLSIYIQYFCVKLLGSLFSAIYDASCTWRGQLPPRSHNNKTLSCKVFLGGVPWDITESNLIQAFRPYGNIRIEWPGKDSSSIPKGYLYIIFEHEKQVRSLLSACTQDFGNGGGSWYFKVSSLKVLEFLHFF